MSRYIGNTEAGPILKAAEHWRVECLQKDGAIFSNAALWTAQHIREVDEYFVNRLDEGEGSFFEKLKVQFEPTSLETKQLVAEMLWLMLLCPDNIGIDAKLEAVRTVWEWSGQPFPNVSEWSKPAVLNGIVSGGISYNINRWRELVFLTRFLIAFKRLESSEKSKILEDGWAFAEWIGSVPDAESRQLRHMLVYLLFPDTFERILGGTDRYQITTRFSRKSRDAMPQLTRDRKLQIEVAWGHPIT